MNIAKVIIATKIISFYDNFHNQLNLKIMIEKSLTSVISKTSETIIEIPTEKEIQDYLLSKLVIRNGFADFLLLGVFSVIGEMFIQKKGTARKKEIEKFLKLSLPEGIKPGEKVKVSLCEYSSWDLGLRAKNAHKYTEMHGGVLPGTFGLVATIIADPKFLPESKLVAGYDKAARYAKGLFSKRLNYFCKGKLEETEVDCIWNISPCFIYFEKLN